MLIKAGADEKIADSRGLIPSYYMQRGNEIYFPDDENLFDPLAGVNSSQNGKYIFVILIRLQFYLV